MKTTVQTGTLRLDDIAIVYQTFQGRYVDAMPALRADNKTALPVRGQMRQRLQVLNLGKEDLIEAWWENYFDSPDGVACKGDEVKYVPNAQLLLDITPEAKLSNGALVLTEKQYDALQGKTFSRKELEKLGGNNGLTKNQVLKHPVWQAVAGDILEQYADAHFKRYNAKTLMGVYFSSLRDKPTIRALALSNGGNHWSHLFGGRYLDGSYARLVGVRQGLEARVVA